MKSYPRYKAIGGYSIRPRLELAGIVKAMGEVEPYYVKVFDLLQNNNIIATAETYEQAQEMAFSLVLKGAMADKLKSGGGYSLHL